MLVAVLKLTGKGWMDEIMAKLCWANWLSWSRRERHRTYGFESSHGWWIRQASLCALDYLVIFGCIWANMGQVCFSSSFHTFGVLGWHPSVKSRKHARIGQYHNRWSFGVFEQALRFREMSSVRLPAVAAKWDDTRWNGIVFFLLLKEAKRGANISLAWTLDCWSGTWNSRL